MRIRNIRPAFFTDHFTGTMPADVALTYVGLWCVADDAGWLRWDVEQLGVEVWPWRPVRARERLLEHVGEVLTAAGKLVIYPCGCASLPTFPDHQRVGGQPSYGTRKEHLLHTTTEEARENLRTTENSFRKGKVGEGREGEVRGGLRAIMKVDPETGAYAYVGPEPTA
jgi:hypothetical protein